MRIEPQFRFLLGAVLACSGATVTAQQSGSQQQSPPPSNAPAQQQQPAQQTPPPKHSTAQDNPFPEDISRKAATGSDAPAAPAPSDKPPTSDHPAARPDYTPDSSSSRSRFQGMDVTGGDHDSAVSDGAGGFIHDPKLALKDVKVGDFYLVQQNYNGAYSRYKEATEVDPGNAEAVFGLAEAARRLNKKDEAIDNYMIYLDAFPDGDKSKSARKALAALGAPLKK
jgi:tetratricopeptide (TPR) repeat protein